jgi:hypothetical protein
MKCAEDHLQEVLDDYSSFRNGILLRVLCKPLLQHRPPPLLFQAELAGLKVARGSGVKTWVEAFVYSGFQNSWSLIGMLLDLWLFRLSKV